MNGNKAEPTLRAVDAHSTLEIAPMRPRFWRRRLVLFGMIILLGIGVGLLIRTYGSTAPAAVPPPVRDAPVLDGEIIRFSPAFAQRAGITTATAAARTLLPMVNVTGTVAYDSRKFAAVGARIEGRARRVFKVVGDPVKAGEVLMEIESADLGRAEAQVFSARARELAAEIDMKRERRLADARITPEKDAETAKANYEVAHAERIAAERAVQAMGGDLDQKTGVLVMHSPIAGKVVSTNVVRGQTVQPSDTVFEIADLSSLWIQLSVFERDLAAVKVNNEVEIVPQGSLGAPIKGHVDHVGDVINVETRSVPVRVVVDNPDRTMRPGQSVQAHINTSALADKVLTVPRTAITRIDGNATVFVMLPQGHAVEPRRVALGPQDANYTAILQGLREGETVIEGGMFALKSEIFR
jgi:cobalt-zinc-cadmium efflux system membrane fusion protein